MPNPTKETEATFKRKQKLAYHILGSFNLTPASTTQSAEACRFFLQLCRPTLQVVGGDLGDP
jgi:hypothetical protein